MSESERYVIEFTEGGVGVLETLLTGGIALIVEKTLDTISGEDNHGWYCTITDKVTRLKAIEWGITKGEAEEKTFRLLKREIENYEEQQEREREEAEYQRQIQIQKEREEAEYQQLQRQRTQQTSYQTSNSDADETSCLVKLFAYLLLIAGALWLLFAVAIPLVLANIATIALSAGLIKKEWDKYLFPLSILGSIGIVLDYNYGWTTEALAINVPFLREYIPVFFYVNVISGLVAAYFLIRNSLNNKYGASENELSKRNVIVMVCLVVVGGLTFGLQNYFDSRSPDGISERKAVISVDEEPIVTGFVQTKEEDSTLRLRSEPSAESAIVASMPNGSAVTILKDSFQYDEIDGEKGRWLKVNYNGKEGWAWSDFIIENTDNFTGNWKGGHMKFTITNEGGRYKVKVTNEGIEGSPTNNLICTFKEGKIFYPGREADYYKYQIPTIELLPNGHLMYRDGADDVELTVVQGEETVTDSTDSSIPTLASVSVPINNLFRAWSELDLNLYMQQWSPNASQHSKKFSARNYQDILNRRQSLFGRLGSVQVVKYDVFDLETEENGHSIIKARYSMDFYFKDGRKVSESNITEKYVLVYDNDKKQWVILENFDYID
jgi:hypothetical protein